MDEAASVMAAAATAVLQQMALDGWAAARSRFTAFLARRRGTTESQEGAELDRMRADLAQARAAGDDEALREFRSDLAGRFRRAVRGDGEALRELGELAAEFTVEQHQTQIRDVHNSVTGGTHYAPVIQTGSVGRIDFGGRS
ncbi:hypothetical protein [Streptomyces tremellae]|uniref:Regulatory protein n=1 Tax=Streptomyces tremellae TaxID=1124239 RepID=A0ABP7FNE7_9ACTN